MNYNANEKGYYGEFGGAYIPEMLYPNVEELRQNYLKIMAEESFQKEFHQLLKSPCGIASATNAGHHKIWVFATFFFV